MTGSLAPVLLGVENAIRRFGGLVAVGGVSFEVPRGAVVGLIGPNGAGKSTMFDLITGMRPVTSGEIRFAGRVVTQEPPHMRSPRGIGRTFQIVRLFSGLNVLENVLLGLHPRYPDGVIRSLLAGKRLARQEDSSRARAMELLDFIGLADRATDRISHLTLGQQRLVDIARALASDPILLMLDEPAAGLNDAETDNLASMLADLKKRGLSMLIVEHDIDFIMNVCDRIVVMDHGVKIADDTPERVRTNDQVISAYIGKRAPDAAH
jgi:ABC-type branched-subunit amino acid transport system ATPase component